MSATGTGMPPCVPGRQGMTSCMSTPRTVRRSHAASFCRSIISARTNMADRSKTGPAC